MGFIEEYWILLKPHVASIVIYLTGILLVAVMSFIVVFDNHAEYIESQLNRNIIEYNEIDREQLCYIAQCLRIESPSLRKTFIPDEKGILTKGTYINNRLTDVHKV